MLAMFQCCIHTIFALLYTDLKLITLHRLFQHIPLWFSLLIIPEIILNKVFYWARFRFTGFSKLGQVAPVSFIEYKSRCCMCCNGHQGLVQLPYETRLKHNYTVFNFIVIGSEEIWLKFTNWCTTWLERHQSIHSSLLSAVSPEATIPGSTQDLTFFTNQVINQWNYLPEYVILSNNLNQFKTYLDHYWS